MYCGNHEIKMDYQFCLNEECSCRLTCIECYVKNDKHKKHRMTMVKDFIRGEESELNRVFNQTYIQLNKGDNLNINYILDGFNAKMDQIMEQREKELKKQIEQIISQSRALIEKQKQKASQRINGINVKGIHQMQKEMKELVESDENTTEQQRMKDSIDNCNKIEEIKNQLDEIVEKLKQNNEFIIN